jgi:hypothetical protein
VALVAGVAVGASLAGMLAAAAVAWRLSRKQRSQPAAGASSSVKNSMGAEAGITPAAAIATLLAAGASAGPGGFHRPGALAAAAAAELAAGEGDVTPAAAAAAALTSRIGAVQTV